MKKKISLGLSLLMLTAFLSACDTTITSPTPANTPTNTIPTLPTATATETTPTPSPSATYEIAPLAKVPDNAFGKTSDMVFESFSMDSTADEVKAKLGTPDETNEYTEEATGQKMMVLDYGEDELTFIQKKDGAFTLNTVSCYSAAKGPRGISVGMPLKDIQSLFSLSLPETLPMEEIKLYGVDSGVLDEGGDPVILAPSGSIYREEGLKFIHLEAPDQPYPAEMDPIEYIYHPHRWLNLEFGENDTLKFWTWSYGALAE